MNRSTLIGISGGVIAVVAALIFSRTSPNKTQKTVAQPSLTNQAVEGYTIYNANCSTCHGLNGAGTNKGPPFVHKIYEPNHHGDASFHQAVKNGVRAHHWPFGNMPPVPNVSDDDVALIVTYIRELQRANGIR